MLLQNIQSDPAAKKLSNASMTGRKRSEQEWPDNRTEPSPKREKKVDFSIDDGDDSDANDTGEEQSGVDDSEEHNPDANEPGQDDPYDDADDAFESET